MTAPRRLRLPRPSTPSVLIGTTALGSVSLMIGYASAAAVKPLAMTGNLTGYAGGLERKMDLLRREGVLSDPIDLLPLN